MAQSHLATVLKHLRGMVDVASDSARTDGQLLDLFVARRDEDAFAALMERHGAMVFGVCRRVLNDRTDAEDAFQATFLVLARRADSIRQQDSLAGWLWRVAFRVSQDARALARRRHDRERQFIPMTPPEKTTTLEQAELRQILDEELDHLPEKYRAPMILCYLEGKTHEEAGRLLRWPEGTLKQRMTKGRELLRTRLTRRGLALSGNGLALALAETAASAAVPRDLMQVALRAAVGSAGEGVIRAEVLALAERLLAASSAFRMKLTLVILIAMCGLGTGTVGLLWATAAAAPGTIVAAADPEGQPGVLKERPSRTDAFGDLLPADALRRIGTLRMRHGGPYGTGHLAFVNGGKALISASSGDGSPRLWETPGGKEVRRYGDLQAVHSIAVSGDSALLATAGMQDKKNVLVLWQVASGAEQCRATLDTNFATALTFSPDGKRLYAMGYLLAADKTNKPTVFAWDSATGKEVHRLILPTQLRRVSFAPDCQTIVGWDGDTLAVHDTATGKEQSTFKGVPYTNGRIVFTRDGKKMAAAGGGSGEAKGFIWDLTTGKQLLEITNHPRGATALAFSPDGKLLASGSGSTAGMGDLIVREVATGKQVCAVPGLAEGLMTAEFSPDGKVVAGYTWDGGIRLWDAATAQEVGPDVLHRCRINGCLSPDGKKIVTIGRDLEVRVWDAAGGADLHRLTMKPLDRHFFQPGCVAVSPDGTVLAVGGYRRDKTGEIGIIKLWDMASGTELRQLQPQKGWILSMSFAPDGKSLAAASQEQTASIWDVGTGKLLHRVTAPQIKIRETPIPGRISSLVYAPHGKLLAGFNFDGSIVFWDSTGDKVLRSWKPSSGSRALAFSPDGKMIATFGGTSDKAVVILYDADTGREIRQIGPYRGLDTAPVFSRDGALLAIGTSDFRDPPTVRIVEVATGQECRRYQGHLHPTTALDFGPGGRTLLSTSGDSTAVLWDVTGLTGRLTGRPLTAEELSGRWADLASDDAGKALDAVWILSAFSAQSVPYAMERIKPAERPKAAQVKQWIADLENNEFAARQRAADELERLDDAVETELRNALSDKPSLDKQKRLELLVQRMERKQHTPSGEAVRRLRVVRMLELCATAEARQVLSRLAEGTPDARLTRETQAALDRLARIK